MVECNRGVTLHFGSFMANKLPPCVSTRGFFNVDNFYLEVTGTLPIFDISKTVKQ